MKIPSDNKWTQLNDGNINGVLHETHNCTLDKSGEIVLSQKAANLVDSTTTNFGDVMAVLYFNSNYIVVTDDKVFEGDLGGTDFTEIASSPSLGSVSDAVVCYSRLYVSDTTSLAYWTGSAWTTGIGSLTASYPHPLAVFDSQTTYKLAVGDGNVVKLYDSSGNVSSTTLTVASNYYVTSLAYRNGYLFVGTKEIYGGEAAIFLWNGSGANANYKIDVGAAWVYSLAPYRGSVCAITNEGELLYVNGTLVEQLGVLPVFNADGALWDAGNATRGKVYPRGLVTLGNRIYINVCGEVDAGTDVPEMRSGIWCYDPARGLYHYASNTADLFDLGNSFTVSNSEFTVSATHKVKLGDAVQFTALSGVTGVSAARAYYAIPTGTTTFKVAGTRQNAFNGEYITITTSVGYTGSVDFVPNDSFGVVQGVQSGALAVISYLDTPDKTITSNLIWGAVTQSNTGTNLNVLSALTDRYNEGSFTTQRIYTDNVEQVWKSLYTFLTGCMGSNEKVIVKMKTEDRCGFPTKALSGSWSTTDTIHFTDPIAFSDIRVGDEVQFISGYGTGRLAHITNVETSAGTVVVTLDEDYGVVGGTSEVRFSDFIKVGEITSDRQEGAYARMSIDAKSAWVQFKIEMRGFRMSVSLLELTNSVHKSAV